MITSTIASLLFGFLSANIPTFFNFLKTILDHKHEYRMSKLQIVNTRENRASKLEEIRINAELDSFKIREENTKIGNVIIDGINQLVKPIFALTFLGMYVWVNYIYYQMLRNVGSPALFADLMWTQQDYDFMGTVVGYYFGGLFKKAYGK
jgi:hypothetical protein